MIFIPHLRLVQIQVGDVDYPRFFMVFNPNRVEANRIEIRGHFGGVALEITVQHQIVIGSAVRLDDIGRLQPLEIEFVEV